MSSVQHMRYTAELNSKHFAAAKKLQLTDRRATLHHGLEHVSLEIPGAYVVVNMTPACATYRLRWSDSKLLIYDACSCVSNWQAGSQERLPCRWGRHRTRHKQQMGMRHLPLERFREHWVRDHVRKAVGCRQDTNPSARSSYADMQRPASGEAYHSLYCGTAMECGEQADAPTKMRACRSSENAETLNDQSSKKRTWS